MIEKIGQLAYSCDVSSIKLADILLENNDAIIFKHFDDEEVHGGGCFNKQDWDIPIHDGNGNGWIIYTKPLIGGIIPTYSEYGKFCYGKFGAGFWSPNYDADSSSIFDD